MEESSSIPSNVDKPVIVRVKRKASQFCLDAFWLEINERPFKRPLLDFGKLSISDASSSRVEEPKKKILVRHLETVTSPVDISDVLRSFESHSSDRVKVKVQHEEARRFIKSLNKRDDLFQAKQKQEVLSRNARFEQIWRSRKEKKDALEDESVHDLYRLYDVVRVDAEEHNIKSQEKDMDLEDCRMMAQFLPLLQEVLPTAAKEIESDIHDSMSKKQASSEDGFVYDFYAVNKDASVVEVDSAGEFPLVQVDDDDDYYDDPDDSEYETDDSNDENNPLNDYPDEETSDDEDEVASSRSSDEKSEDESETSDSESRDLETGNDESYNEHKDSEPPEWSDDENQFDEYGVYW